MEVFNSKLVNTNSSENNLGSISRISQKSKDLTEDS